VRLFVALPIAEPLEREAARWAERHSELPVRWLAGKNLHITLVPPWEAPDARAATAALRAVRGIGPFAYRLEHIAFGPDPRAPRLIWAEGKSVPGALRELELRTGAALGHEPARRAFRLHLTLARFRPEAFASFPVRRLDEVVSWEGVADAFVLMESHLSPHGADYEVAGRFPLAG
jgi:2'-5' RNA ligase